MPYVTVIAEFPNITLAARETICACLEIDKWKQVSELSKGKSMVWYAYFRSAVTENIAIQIAINDFETYSQVYCKPRLLIQYGLNKPTIHVCQ